MCTLDALACLPADAVCLPKPDWCSGPFSVRNRLLEPSPAIVSVPLPPGANPWADGWVSPPFVYDPHPDATVSHRIFLLAIVLRAIKDAAGDGADAEEARQWLAGASPFTHEREGHCALLALVTPWSAAQWAACLTAYAMGRRQVPAWVAVWTETTPRSR